MSGFKTKDGCFYPESRFDLSREKPMCSRRESLQAYGCQLYTGPSVHCVLESRLVPRETTDARASFQTNGSAEVLLATV